MLKASQVRSESNEELTLKLETLQGEVFQLRSPNVDNKNQKTHLISQKRKEIARILTVMKERERG